MATNSLTSELPSGAGALARSTGYEYVFPAIRGVQAGREYYVTMCPLRLIPRLFLFDEEELPPEMRAQRNLNRLGYRRCRDTSSKTQTATSSPR